MSNVAVLHPKTEFSRTEDCARNYLLFSLRKTDFSGTFYPVVCAIYKYSFAILVTTVCEDFSGFVKIICFSVNQK